MTKLDDPKIDDELADELKSPYAPRSLVLIGLLIAFFLVLALVISPVEERVAAQKETSAISDWVTAIGA